MTDMVAQVHQPVRFSPGDRVTLRDWRPGQPVAEVLEVKGSPMTVMSQVGGYTLDRIREFVKVRFQDGREVEVEARDLQAAL